MTTYWEDNIHFNNEYQDISLCMLPFEFVSCMFPILGEVGAKLNKLNPLTLLRMNDIKDGCHYGT